MTSQAIVFDIGGVLEITPDLGLTARWRGRLTDLARAGMIGEITEQEFESALRERLGAEADDYLDAMWREYLGTLNTELAAYLRGLRPRHRTGILSNSFVGAREREQAAYGFEDLVDEIVYSHEAGLAKPDPRAFLLVCERLGARPRDTVFLDDVPAFVEAAREAGLRGVLFESTAQAIADVDALLTAR
ncbi:MAG: HAD family phosphatase [Nonomuraea sp.]|nr:HAD family phosphatase [Nonomuraea sp.]